MFFDRFIDNPDAVVLRFLDCFRTHVQSRVRGHMGQMAGKSALPRTNIQHTLCACDKAGDELILVFRPQVIPGLILNPVVKLSIPCERRVVVSETTS